MAYVKKPVSNISKRLGSQTVSEAVKIKVTKPKQFNPKVEPVERFRSKTKKRGSVTL